MRDVVVLALATTVLSSSASSMASSVAHPVFAAPPAKGATTSAAKSASATKAVSEPVDIDTAEDFYAQLDYERANRAARDLLETNGLSHDDVVRTYRLLAITYAILDKPNLSRDAFLQLLTCNPDFKVDTGLGPKVTEPFQEARGRFRSLLTMPGIDVKTSIVANGGTLQITTRNPTRMVKHVVVGYRWGSSGTYVKSEAPADGTTSIEIAAPPDGQTRVDYYAQALDGHEHVLFETGNPRAPKSAFVASHRSGWDTEGRSSKPKREDDSFVGSPAFWVLTGLLVVGGGTAAYFAFRPGDAPTSAALTPVLLCGGQPCN